MQALIFHGSDGRFGLLTHYNWFLWTILQAVQYTRDHHTMKISHRNNCLNKCAEFVYVHTSFVMDMWVAEHG